MSEMKRCVQCGLLKEDTAFRKYTYSRTNDTEGRYRICRSCEAINTAYRRALCQIADECQELPTAASRKAHDTIDRTEKLYDVLAAKGLRVPAPQPKTKQEDPVEDLLNFYATETTSTVDRSTEVPDELKHWLEEDPSVWRANDISPEYLQETIYESLKAKYRPQIGVNRDTYVPIYDDTFKKELNDILRRFDDYEEECCDNAIGGNQGQS